MRKPNHLLEEDVRAQLGWDPLLDASRIQVSANDGEVTLTGAVPTFDEFLRAGEGAWTVSGVRGVNNQLLVGTVGEAIADTEVAAACATAIDGDRAVPKDAITVDVSDGWVTLTGHVRHHLQRQAAELDVRRVKGVRGLTDKVEISSDPVPGDVVARISKALQRNAIVGDSLITVSNVGHTVYLDGTTTSWAARQQADDTAWAAPGVNAVIDRITIVP